MKDPVAKTRRLAEAHAKAAEVLQAATVDGAELHPHFAPRGGYADLVFRQALDFTEASPALVLARIVDAGGDPVEIGHWLDGPDDTKILRVKYPITKTTAREAATGTVSAEDLERPRSGTQSAQVLGVFIGDYKRDGNGLTDTAVVELTGLKKGSATARRTDLTHTGWLVRCGTAVNATGDEVGKYQLSAAALLNLRMEK